MHRAFREPFMMMSGLALLLGACGSAQTPGTADPAAAAAPQPGPKHTLGENPFVNATWWSDPYGLARLQSLRLKKTDPEGAALLEKIARYGGADWVGEWTPNIENWMRKRVTLIHKNGALPVFVAYKIPKRDCGQYSAGGAKGAPEYKEWITALARGIGGRKAVVILEPDALGLMDKCLSPEDQKERLELLRFAIDTLESWGQTWVYLDAGHSGWLPAPEISERLKAAGIANADGFALNTSNYKATDELLAYGKKISAATGGKPFVIDTSRNGNGPPDVKDPSSEESWCNPAGRALGVPPTSQTADPLCHAYLWIKKPGESDGECNGGPKAGAWYADRALEMAKNAKW